jgi:hypothetical protein
MIHHDGWELLLVGQALCGWREENYFDEKSTRIEQRVTCPKCLDVFDDLVSVGAVRRSDNGTMKFESLDLVRKVVVRRRIVRRAPKRRSASKRD